MSFNGSALVGAICKFRSRQIDTGCGKERADQEEFCVDQQRKGGKGGLIKEGKRGEGKGNHGDGEGELLESTTDSMGCV